MALWRTSSRSNSFCRAIRFASAIFILFLERTVKNHTSSKGTSNVRGVTRLNLRSRLIRNSPQILPGTYSKGDFYAYDHNERRNADLLQRLGQWPAHRLFARMAFVGRRLGHSNDVLPKSWLSGHRP